MSSDATASQRELKAAMAGFQRGPQYAVVECSTQNCEASHKIENAALLSVDQIRELLAYDMWAWDPVQCPDHNQVFQSRFEIARKAISEATEESLRLLVLASGVTLDELNQRFPQIRDQMARRSASAAVRALLRNT